MGSSALFGFVLTAVVLTLAVSPRALAQSAPPTHAGDSADACQVLQQRPDRVVAVLPNRMVVVAQALRSAPVVSAQVWVKTGSVYEQEHVGAGLSHFLEHLLAGGSTSTRPEADSNAMLGDLGGLTNAATSLATAHYYINATRPYADQAVALLSDWIQNNLITETEYARERQVIQNEFAMGQGDPGRLFWRLTQQARYTAHPARHPTIGYLEDFLAITRDELYDFYRRMYVPNNMVFVVTGDIDPAAMVAHVADLWADVAPGPLPDLSFPVEPQLTEPRHVEGRADVRAPRLRLAFPGTKLAEDGDYALDLLGVILGQGESSRLVRSLRDEKQLVNTIEAYNLSFAWGKGFFGIDAEVAMHEGAQAGAAVRTVRDAALAEIERVKTEGVTPAELDRAKRKTLVSVVLSAQTAEGLASRLASDVISTGDVDYLARYVDAVQAMTAADVQAAARRFLDSQRFVEVTLLPADEQHPVTQLGRNTDAQPNAAAFDLEPIDLDNRVLIDALRANLGVQGPDKVAAVVESPVLHTLSNGLRVVVGRSTLVPGVAIQYYQPGGLLADAPGREGLANAVAAMLTRGTATRSAQQIAHEVDALGASLSASGGNNTTYVQAVCLSEDLPTMLELFADVLLAPSFPDDEWARRQQLLLAAIDREVDRWSGELRKHFRQTYYDGHVWSQLAEGRREAVASFTADDLRNFHAATLDAGDGVLAVFGDIEAQTVVRRIEAVLGLLPSPEDGDFVTPMPASPRSIAVAFETGKPLAAVQIGFGPGVTRDDPDYAALRVLGKIVSRFPSGHLEQALRGEGKGLAYAVGAWTTTGLVPGYFAVLWNTSSADLPESLDAAAAVLHRIRVETVSDTDLQRAKAAVLTEEFLGKQTNGERAAEAALDLVYGLGLDASERFLDAVEAITPERLQQIAHRYLCNPVIVIIADQPVDAELLESVKARLADVGSAGPTTAQPAGE